jgi:hypothetical protein
LALVLGLFGASVFLFACPKKQPPPPVEETPPPQPEAGSGDLTPLVEDAGTDADADAAKPHTGPAVNPVYARLSQCCHALSSQAAALGNSPEAGMLKGAALQCNELAKQATTGTAPELAGLRNALKMVKVPPLCQGL